jgi:23S rRNA pseudouridine1911/1915/1917 synthase
LTSPIEVWTIPYEAAQTRLDQYLKQALPAESRSQIQSWIRNGRVRINGAMVKTGYRLKPNDRVTIDPPENPPAGTPAPEPLPLTLIHKDQDLAVVDKPAGMVCHIGAGVRTGTLVNALLYHLGPLEAGDPARPGIVHRLDKLTSGVMVVARNNATHRALADQFKRREVEKEYLALVYGHPKAAAATITLPLGRDTRNRKKISVKARRKRSALTEYQTIREYGPFTLLRVQIKTGRTHQIRVHLAQIGHPVVGDTLYGGGRTRNLSPELSQVVDRMQRVFLHAHRLGFRHPTTGVCRSFSAPLPEELERFLSAVADLSKLSSA